jgi:hypothetical protein
MKMTSLAALLPILQKSIFTLDTLVDLSRNTRFTTHGRPLRLILELFIQRMTIYFSDGDAPAIIMTMDIIAVTALFQVLFSIHYTLLSMARSAGHDIMGFVGPNRRF